MKLSEYDDEDLIEEIKRRGIELKIHIDSVEVSVSLGGIAFGDCVCKEMK